MSGHVLSLSTCVEEKHGPVKVVVTVNSEPSENLGADKLVAFDIPGGLADGKIITVLRN